MRTVVIRCQEHPFFDGSAVPLEAECIACWALYYSQLPDDLDMEQLEPIAPGPERDLSTLIEKLEVVEGRTPEEAAAYLAKARELRARAAA